MIVNDFEQPPIVNNGQFVAASDVNLWLRNCAYLDQMSYRREPVFDHRPNAASHHNMPGTTGWLLWRGGLLYKAHYTTLTLVYRRIGTIAVTGRLRVFVNGVMRSEFAPVLGDGAVSIALAGQGYTSDFPLLIELRTSGIDPTDRTSEWWVKHLYAVPAYVAPTLSDPSLPVIGGAPPTTSVNGARPWIPMATFTDQYTQTALNILSNNQLHLYDRMNQVPLSSNRAFLTQEPLSHRSGDYDVWTGTASKYTANDQYRITGNITLLTAGSDTIKVYMEDVLQTTIGPFTTVGTHAFDTTVALAGTVPRRIRVKLTYNSTILRGLSVPSRLNILTHRSEPIGGIWPAITPYAPLVGGANTTQPVLTTRLNQIVYFLNAIKTRADNSVSFTVVRAYRDNFGDDEHSRRKLDRYHPAVFQRRGSRLVIYGKNVQLGFGGQVFELDEDNHATYKYKFANEQNIISGGKFDLKTIYLDSIKGLYPGDLYYLAGDITYCGEFHK